MDLMSYECGTSAIIARAKTAGPAGEIISRIPRRSMRCNPALRPGRLGLVDDPRRAHDRGKFLQRKTRWTRAILYAGNRGAPGKRRRVGAAQNDRRDGPRQRAHRMPRRPPGWAGRRRSESQSDLARPVASQMGGNG